MSDKSVLEQVLEHLLAEDDAQAKELLHSFMVEKSRAIYEELLDKDALEEATNFSKNQSAKNDSSADHDASPKFPKKENFGTDEKELFGKDGAEGKKGDSAKDNPSSDNIGEKPASVSPAKVNAEKSESPIAGKVK